MTGHIDGLLGRRRGADGMALGANPVDGVHPAVGVTHALKGVLVAGVNGDGDREPLGMP